MKHLRFISRTFLCKDNQVDETFKALTRVLATENIIKTYKRWQTFERPYQRRNRLCFEKCKQIYNGEMDRKIQFIVRKNRENPYPWD